VAVLQRSPLARTPAWAQRGRRSDQCRGRRALRRCNQSNNTTLTPGEQLVLINPRARPVRRASHLVVFRRRHAPISAKFRKLFSLTRHRARTRASITLVSDIPILPWSFYALQRDDHLLHPAMSGDLHRPALEPGHPTSTLPDFTVSSVSLGRVDNFDPESCCRDT
jgi:hypothetical protein